VLDANLRGEAATPVAARRLLVALARITGR
jgi:hypothetical protein